MSDRHEASDDQQESPTLAADADSRPDHGAEPAASGAAPAAPPANGRRSGTDGTGSAQPQMPRASGDVAVQTTPTHIYNIVAGDWVGRDNSVFIGTGPGTDGTVGADAIRSLGEQIARARRQLTRLIPVERALQHLSEMRVLSQEPKHLSWPSWLFRPRELTEFKAFGMEVKLTSLASTEDRSQRIRNGTSAQHLEELSNLETEIAEGMDKDAYSVVVRAVSAITDLTNVKISQLTDSFLNLVYTSTATRGLVENTVARIGHRELKEEAERHLVMIGVLDDHLSSLGLANLTGIEGTGRTHMTNAVGKIRRSLVKPVVDILGSNVQAAIGVMRQIEEQRIAVEGLLRTDRRRRSLTVQFIIIYIVFAVFAMVGLVVYWGLHYPAGQMPLSEMRLPLMGIPSPVLIWSLIGSFAAMIYTFNRSPIYDFGDAFKWMITRPVQGVVLGAAFYLVLASGLFVLTGGTAAPGGAVPPGRAASTGTPTAETTGTVTADAIVLVLSFLVGFSDRFADSVFNTLVRTYSIVGAGRAEEVQTEAARKTSNQRRRPPIRDGA